MPYSHREDFIRPAGSKDVFYQPFTMKAWNASHFAGEAGSAAHIDLDLGGEQTVTGLGLEQALLESACQELSILVSLDGKTWQSVGTTNDKTAEIVINGYRSGAWIPGCPARYVRIQNNQPFALPHCVLYKKD